MALISTSRVRHAIVAALAVALLAPNARWIYYAWVNSPVDRAGPWFWGFALAWWAAVALMVRPEHRLLTLSALPLLVAWLIVGSVGVALDVRVLQAAGGIGVAWALGWGILGAPSGLLLIPALAASILGLPTTGYLLDEFWLSLGVVSPGVLTVKTALCAVIMLVGAVGLAVQWSGRSLTVGPFFTTCAMLVVATAIGLGLVLRPPQFGPPVWLDESLWAFDEWVGAEIEATPGEQRLFGDTRLSKRVYARPDGQRVAVLIVRSEDVHQLHAPEYCLTGSGWTIRERMPSPWSVGSPRAATAQLTATRGADQLTGVYWFTSSSRSTTDLAGLRLQSRIAPQEPFTLYMVTAIDDATGSGQTLSSFLGVAPWQTP